jgi:hypothetical protein
MANEPPVMSDRPEVLQVTIELHSDGRGLPGLGSRSRRALAICTAVVIAVAGAIVTGGSLSGSPSRTTAAVAPQIPLRCMNAPTTHVFFAYRPPSKPPPPKPVGCP